MNVTSSVQIGGSSLENGISLRVHRTVGAVAGLCEIVLPRPVPLDASPGDDVLVNIGTEEPVVVFTGLLDAAESRASCTLFRALDSRIIAARARVNQLFLEQTSDTILGDLASAAGLDTGSLSAGIALVCYLADDSRSVLGHLAHMAELGGSHLFVTKDGNLETTSFASTGAGLRFHYGEHVLALGAATRLSGGAVEVRTAGAAASNGVEAAFWPTTDTASAAGLAMDDGPLLKQWRPEIRTMEDAATVATSSAQQRANTGLRVVLTCLGLPEVELCDEVALVAAPGQPGEVMLRVIGLEHRFNPWDGFVTSLTMEGTSG